MNKQDIIYFLTERPGYSKEGKRRLQKVLERKGYDVSLEECAEALRKFNSSDELTTEEDTFTHDVPEGFRIKSMWQQGGQTLFSYERDDSKPTNDILEKAIDDLAEYNANRKFFPITEEGNGVVVHSIADLHIGAHVRDLINTPDYDISIVSEKLHKVADEINKQNNESNIIAFLGDLIESFTGLNHINSWKSIQKGMYGGKVLITAYEIILDFLERIHNLEGVYIIAGNHDRVTSRNDEDTEGDTARIISYFLEQRVNCPVKFHTTVLSEDIDGINYIFHHGDKGFARGDLADIVLAFGNNTKFNVVLSGHLHTRNRKERQTYINEDTRKYRAYTCPSIFTGNEYSENLNFTTISGFFSFSNCNGIPKMIDTPIV